ncbi:hypothetical protein LP316_06455 [Thalassotalea sp. LPB0316]|uniref:hypothetical protein n=1 Tax=Thalassotalea sp. LPB0316 TaxID=2769490 RepID=UPI001866C225|nr:hypothetical protein [Thalassotalea sp. LPB0316]QOL26930.1 hypothetical protein LP316_06455 [Thalassotalea sp. LPB0316]
MQPIKVLSFLFVFLLSACSDPVAQQIEQQIPITKSRIEALSQALTSGQVTNAALINQYAQKVTAAKPELADIVKVIARDATPTGPMYKGLMDRFDQAQNMPQLFSTKEERYQELLNIYQAADPILFSDALSDPLNVLADMSDGMLPRVNALSKAQSMQANGAQDFGVGEQLIGNPNYGQWQTGSNGLSFWEWYGMYALMDNLFGSRRVYYSDWGRYRNYSYYSDYGRTRYSSPSSLRKQVNLDNRTRKSFESKGQKYTSAYAKNRTGASSISQKSKAAQTNANRFQKTTTNKSAYASSNKKNASFRNSRTNTSRGTRRGK